MKSKLAWVGFLVALVAMPLRMAQLFLGAPDWGPIGIACLAALGGGAALTALSARRSDRTVMRLPLRGRGLAGVYLGMGALLTGVSLVGVARTGLHASFPSLTAICTLLSVFAGVILFLEGALFAADGQNFAVQHPVLVLAPVFWSLMVIVIQICADVAALSVQGILQTALAAFLALGMLALGQMAAGTRAVTRGRLFGWCLPAIACALAAGAPRILWAVWTASPVAVSPPGFLILGLLLAVFLWVSLATVRPATREERVGEMEPEEEPSVRPVVMMDPPAMSGPRLHAGRRPVVASREDPRPLSPTEADLRTERVLVRYLQQAWDARCYFYKKTRASVRNATDHKKNS